MKTSNGRLDVCPLKELPVSWLQFVRGTILPPILSHNPTACCAIQHANHWEQQVAPYFQVHMDPHIYLQEPRQPSPVSSPQPWFLSCVHAVRKLSESLGYMVEHDSEWQSMGNPCKRCMYISTFTVCSLPVDACCVSHYWLPGCASLYTLDLPLLSPLLGTAYQVSEKSQGKENLLHSQSSICIISAVSYITSCCSLSQTDRFSGYPAHGQEMGKKLEWPYTC